MVINTLKVSSSYLIIQRKTFNRLVLPYEVILDSWCYLFHGKTLLSEDLVQSFIESSDFSEDKVVLELENTTKIKKAYSLSSLGRVIFSSNAAREQFLDLNYDNFDVSSLECAVFECSNLVIDDSSILLEPPYNPSPKSMMVPTDGFIALVFDKITVEKKSSDYFKNLFPHNHELKDLIVLLFDSDALNKKDEIEVLKVFIDLCFENSLDLGWDPESILQTLHDRLSNEVRGESRLQSWVKKTSDILSGSGGLNIPLDDDGSVILRSIILTLLNPERHNLVAIKENFSLEIGDKVFDMAKNFTLLRSGYSLFNCQERESLGGMRGFIQDLNAALYNDELNCFFNLDCEVVTQSSELQESIGKTSNVTNVDLSEVSFISSLLDKLGESKVYSIDGVTPNAGFKSELVDQSENGICLWLIDLRSDDKNSKYKGKMALDLLKVQSELPRDYRFEVNDEGVFLRFPRDIVNENELLDTLKIAYKGLALIKAFNVRKSTLI